MLCRLVFERSIAPALYSLITTDPFFLRLGGKVHPLRGPITRRSPSILLMPGGYQADETHPLSNWYLFGSKV